MLMLSHSCDFWQLKHFPCILAKKRKKRKEKKQHRLLPARCRQKTACDVIDMRRDRSATKTTPDNITFNDITDNGILIGIYSHCLKGPAHFILETDTRWDCKSQLSAPFVCEVSKDRLGGFVGLLNKLSDLNNWLSLSHLRLFMPLTAMRALCLICIRIPMQFRSENRNHIFSLIFLSKSFCPLLDVCDPLILLTKRHEIYTRTMVIQSYMYIVVLRIIQLNTMVHDYNNHS